MMTVKFKNIINSSKKGAVLLIVLIIVMAITIFSFGFLSKSSVQLECGDSMLLRTQLDYLAESALDLTKAKLLSPQNINGLYWQGGQVLLLEEAAEQFFDVNVIKTDNCNYTVAADAYLLKDGQKTAHSRLNTNLRLNPAIAYWQGKNLPITGQVIINGDVYCSDNLLNYGQIYGDVYCAKTITNFSPGIIGGRKSNNVAAAPVSLPVLDINNFNIRYYIEDRVYSAGQLTEQNYMNLILEPSETNPAGVYYRDGNIELFGANIKGMLIIKDNMILRGPNTVTITATKNFPALLVGNDISFEEAETILNVTGLASVAHLIDCKNKFNCRLSVNGALLVEGDGIQNTEDSQVNITANPDLAAVKTWLTPVSAESWSPSADAVFQKITRN